MVAAAGPAAKPTAGMVIGMHQAVVTGAGGGLGRAIAIELGRRGYGVHATDVDADAFMALFLDAISRL